MELNEDYNSAVAVFNTLFRGDLSRRLATSDVA